ncbi:cyclin-dependent kinase 2-like [Oratosquilla oratoria]|uniref:cyclin-dependent kinase 2-like n=1 Tax=Oratosquilla oratoria TaxID=337810 RepID=UPI003F75A5C9
MDSGDGRYIIGKGSFSTVYLIQDVNTNAHYAYKVSQITVDHVKQATDKEIRALTHLKGHRNIELFDVSYVDQAIGLVLDLVPFTLHDILSYCRQGATMPPAWAKSLLRDLIYGVAHSHATGFIHFDLKPSNLLVAENGVLKIADFGLSEHQDDYPFQDKMTASYRPPEVYPRPDILAYDSDLWSIGVIVIEVLT